MSERKPGGVALPQNSEDSSDQTPPRAPDLAVALRYRAGIDRAPILTAKGAKGLALRMILDARMHDVPVVRDPGLAAILDRLKYGAEIPDNLYRAIVEIFAFIKSSGSTR